MNRGKYIVIEGLANHREAILQRLATELGAAQLAVKVFREPESQNDLTARAINRLTHDPRYPMTTRTEVLLYNAARVQSLETIRQAVEEGVICLVDRSYLTTLAVQYYGYGELQDYARINDIIEFAVHDMQPDLTVVLDTPVAELDAAVSKKFFIGRVHVEPNTFLERVRAGYLWEAQQRGLPVVYATVDSDQVFKDVWKHVAATLAVRDKSAHTSPESVAAVLAANPVTKASAAEPPVLAQPSLESEDKPAELSGKATSPLDRPRYYIPTSLDKPRAAQYKSSLNKLLKKYQQLRRALPADKAEVADLVLPVACSVDEATGDASLTATNPLTELAQRMLKNDYGKAADELVQLVDYWPRNELALVASMLYSATGINLETLREQTSSWSYQQKTDILSAAARAEQNTALHEAGYLFELVTSYADLIALRKQAGARVVHQYLSPRQGFEVPDTVESAGLTELFEECFDLSLELHSQLQAAGFEAEAQYVTLLGHKHHAKLTLSAAALQKIISDKISPAPLADALQAAAAEVHPLLTEGYATKQPARA